MSPTEPASPSPSTPPKLGWWKRVWLQVQRIPRLSIFLLDWLAGLSQRLLFLAVIVAVGFSLWQLIRGEKAQRDQVLELVRLFNECWKVLIVVAVLVFRREIASLMARVVSLGKDGAQFAVPESGEDLGMDDAPSSAAKRASSTEGSQPAKKGASDA